MTRGTNRLVDGGSIKMGQVLVNGITVAYEDVGAGENVLVLVHGHPFNRTMWRPQVEWIANLNLNRARARDLGVALPTVRFGDQSESTSGDCHTARIEHEHDSRMRPWRVIAPDLRGYGDSTVVSGKTTLDVFAGDIAGLLDRLDIREVVIGGLSMGGQIVMEFCRQYPERVRGVLFAATISRAETEDGKRQRATMADRLLKEGMGPYAQEFLSKMVAPGNLVAFPAVAEHVRGMMQAANPIGAAAAVRGRADRPDYEETLAGLDVPALVVVGDQDAFTTRTDAKQMAGILKGSELVWMKGVGHMPNLERATEFNDALGRLLRRTE
jgi:pimeloyl-ACP methyl ester carboxylesterase